LRKARLFFEKKKEEYPMAVDLKNVLTQEEAVKIALEIERYEAALKQMKDRLKEYVNANGSLTAGDKVWDFFPTETWEFEAAKLKELAVGIAMDGKDPWEYLSISAAALKALGMTEAELNQYGIKKVSRRFMAKKGG
jgi:hypothetical protein